MANKSRKIFPFIKIYLLINTTLTSGRNTREIKGVVRKKRHYSYIYYMCFIQSILKYNIIYT